MRVLHVISNLDARGGGPAVALAGLAAAQVAAGLDVSIVATFRAGDDVTVADTLRGAGATVNMVGPASGPLARHPDLVPALEKAVASADVVHVHALWEEVQHQAARVARRQRKPYIIRPCGMLDPWSLSQSRLKKRLYMVLRLRRNLNRAAALHFTSDTERDLTAPLKLTSSAIVEPNGVR